MKKALITIFIISTILTGEGDSPQGVLKNYHKNRAKKRIELPLLTERFNNRAKFISGEDINKDSELHGLTKSDGYLKYKRLINNNWKIILAKNLSSCREWSHRYIPVDYSRFIFYPFSGPDILHPLSFYPEGNEILMFGLEPVGKIPEPEALPEKNALYELWLIPRALNFILKHAFFVTLDMRKSIGTSSYDGITGVMMFFLSRGGYDIRYVRKIWIDKKGLVVYIGNLKAKRIISGVEIVFQQEGWSDLKRVRYFQLDISDYSRQLPYFIRYMKRRPLCTTIIKSASYLMHDDSKFKKIKNLILKRSRSILQDDSGIPYQAFSNNIWKIKYHGYYHRPLKVFKMHYQKKLELDLKKYSSGVLPFVYGYGYGFDDMTYHLIHAVKIGK